MARKMTKAAEVVLEILEQFPTATTMTLARKAYRDNPALWKNCEACRDMFRHYRGAHGAKKLASLSVKSHVRVIEPPKSPFVGIPEGIVELKDWKPFEIPGPCKALLLADPHVPYHDRDAMLLACTHGQAEGVDVVVLLGDFMDCFALSRWENDPRERDFRRELDTGREVLSVLREGFPNARIIYKLGNHDERLERYLSCKAPELLDVADFEMAALLRCAELNIEVVTDLMPLLIGKLYALHGHEYKFNISNPVNPARGLFLRGKVLAICGHFHQTSQHSEKSMDDSVVSCWSIGCLCNMRPRYMPLNKWNHGYAIVSVDDSGAFQVDNKRIIDGGVWS
jgi:predicted phosphodiesterase